MVGERRWLAKLLAGGVREGETPADVAIRIRYLNGAMLTMLAIAVPFSFQYASLGAWRMVVALGGCIIGAIGNMWFIRSRRNVSVAGYVGCGLLFGLLLASNITSGGFYDPNFGWLYVVPLAGAFLANLRATFALTGVVLVTTVVFWALPVFGVELVSAIPVDQHAVQSLANRLSAVVAIGIVTWLVVRQQTSAEEALRKRADELERVNHELDRFAYVSSHDLRSPLHNIATLAEFIEVDIANVPEVPDEVSRNVSLLRQRVRRMDALLMSLQEFARVGKRDAPPEKVALPRLLADIAKAPDLPAGYEIDVGPLPTIQTAWAPLERVIESLIDNAITHRGDAGTRVQVRAETSDDMVIFSVEDDGPGIPSDLHDKAFKIFTTLKRRDEVEGSGMGLPLARKIVETHGGWFELISEGRGCLVRFGWPCVVLASPTDG